MNEWMNDKDFGSYKWILWIFVIPSIYKCLKDALGS